MSEALFLHYDRAALDAEYDNRAKVTGAEDYIARWKARSKEARSKLDCNLDLAYGSSNAETLDIFLSNTPGKSPINIFFHGGYWRALHKDEFSYVAYSLHETGAVTVVVNYALVPEVSFDELVRQCRAALAWVWNNADDFGGDREQLFVSGHSAGGHLVAMMMATDWPVFDVGLPAQPICGGCGISGLYDLEPIRLCFLNEDLKLSEETAKRNSPMKQKRTCLSPLLLPVGASEGPEYLRQSNELSEAWSRSGETPKVLIMPDHNHFSIAAQLDDSESELSRAIQDQMGLHPST
jgi:arylformamidase